MIPVGPRVPATRATALALAALCAAALVAAALVAACGTTTGSPSPAPSSSTAPGPVATPWLGNAVLGIEAMGVADGEIRKGMSDFNTGVQTGDPRLMLEAARGLAGVDVLLKNVDQIEPFEPMRPFAAKYREAITLMSAAAKELQAALEGGDGPATTAASQKLIESFTKYASVQADLAAFVVQIPEQKRMLVR